MNALEILAVLCVAISLAVIVAAVLQVANSLLIESPPGPGGPPGTDPAVEPPDPFDALLDDLELFRLTNMSPEAIEVPELQPVARLEIVVAAVEVVDVDAAFDVPAEAA